MSFHSNIHMMIGSQQMVARDNTGDNMVVDRDIHEEKSGDSQAGEKTPRNTSQRPSIFLDMVRREFSDKLSYRPRV